jgi:hypothetical protein
LLAITSGTGCETLWGGFSVPNQGYCSLPDCSDDAGVGPKADGDAGTAPFDLSLTGDLAGLDLGVVGPTIVAVGTKGTILRRVYGAWRPDASPTTSDLVRVHASDAKHILAVGKTGTIVGFDGILWKTQLAGKYADLSSIYVRSATEAWASGAGGTLLSWNGQLWASLTSPSTGQIVSIVGWPAPLPLRGVTNLGNGTNELLGSADGTSWAITAGAGLPAAIYMKMWGSSASSLWAVGGNSHLVQWNGSAWTSHTSPVPSSLNAVWGFGLSNVWVVGSGGVVLRYSGPAAGWIKVAVPSTANLLDIYGTALNDIWVVGEGGTILHFDGLRWEQEPSPTLEALSGVWAGS